MGEKGQCNLVCVVPLNDWATAGLYVDVLCTFGECGVNFLGSWSYSKGWV